MKRQDVAENVIQITNIGTVVVVFGHPTALARTSACTSTVAFARTVIGFIVDTVKARGGTASQGTRRGAVIRCLTLRRQVVTRVRRRRGRNRVIRTVKDAWRHVGNQRRMATPRDCTCTKVNDNITADSTTDNRRACRRVKQQILEKWRVVQMNVSFLSFFRVGSFLCLHFLSTKGLVVC